MLKTIFDHYMFWVIVAVLNATGVAVAISEQSPILIISTVITLSSSCWLAAKAKCKKNETTYGALKQG